MKDSSSQGPLAAFLNACRRVFQSSPQTGEKSVPTAPTSPPPRVFPNVPVWEPEPDAPPSNAGAPDVAKPLTPVRLPERHRMPYRSLDSRFVGRTEVIAGLHARLMGEGGEIPRGVAVVVGANGLGKSCLAIEYAHRFGEVYPGGLFWVDAAMGLSSMILQVADGAAVCVDKKRPAMEQLKALWKSLLGFEAPVLLILDDFQDEALEPWLPPPGDIHVLVTTAQSGLSCDPIALAPMSKEEGRALLGTKARSFGEEADPLLTALGGTPLVLGLARHLLDDTPDLTPDALLKELSTDGDAGVRHRFLAKYDGKLPSGHEREMTRAFEMSVRKAVPRAVDVLKAIALAAPVPVPRRLIAKILDVPMSNGYKDSLSHAIDELVTRLGLVALDEQNNDPFLHSLIAGYVTETMSARDPVRKQVVTAVRSVMRQITDEQDTAAYKALGAVIPHAEALYPLDWLTPEEAVDLTSYLGWYYRRQGAYQIGATYRRRALERAEKAYASGHPIVARCQSDLALALKDLGELQEARALLTAALTSAEASYEPGHEVTAIRRSNLALVLQDLGERKEAVAQHRLALTASEKAYPSGHPHIAKHQSNLALVLQEQGAFEEARQLLEKALGADEQTYQRGHPIISRRQANLALVLRDLGRLEEAKGLLQKALAADEKIYDDNHPELTVRQSTMALVLKDLGELEEARALAEKVYAASLRTLGPDHKNTVIFKNFLRKL